jgi:selenide,water dikinase
MNIVMKKVPLIGHTWNLIDDGCIPGASFSNLNYADEWISFSSDLDYNLKMIAFDAQTSGGLLMCVPSGIKDKVVLELKKSGLTETSIIGEITEKREKLIYLSN